jgi:Ca2+-binding RTX toxin-like protein
MAAVRFASLALLLVLVLGSLAHAGTAPSYVDHPIPERGRSQLTVNGGQADNVVVLELDRAFQWYLLSDTAGITAGEGCEARGPTKVRCVRREFDGFGAGLGPGDDHFILTIPWRRGTIRGGAGADVLRSGDARNVLLGGLGADTLRGRGGNDGLFGERGRDRLFGGEGHDRLDALDGARDRAIDCGPGDDVAVVDRDLDPEPRACEIVLRRRFQPPAR